MNIRRNEQSIYRVSHFQAAVAIHSAAKAYFFRDELRIKVAKHRDKMAAIADQRRRFQERILKEPAETGHSNFFSEPFEDDQSEEPTAEDRGDQDESFDDEDDSDSSVLAFDLAGFHAFEHDIDAELRWFEQEYGNEELHLLTRLASTCELDEETGDEE